MLLQLLVLISVTSANALGFWNTFTGIMSVITGASKENALTVQAEDAYLNIVKLAEKYGYSIQTHTVNTEDGYVLKMHRIPHGKYVPSNGKVIFLMHGIWESSDSWLLLGPNKALAYMLADRGFDVWIGNARGNKHTLKHKTLSAKSTKFWNFTWDEIGLYDLPAMIDYILNLTGRKALYYVGFSQGTTSFFVMNSMRPEYNKKIIRMYALAPEVYLGNAKHVLLQIFSPATSMVHDLMQRFNIFSSSTDFMNSVTPYLCLFLPIRCNNFFISIAGPNNVNESMWPVILGHMPTGSSTLQFLHYGQLVSSKRFCRYDFGKEENIKRYNQTTPPDYNLKAVTSPVVLFYSGNDWFSDKLDVEILKTKITRVIKEYYIKLFTHIDFMYADEASTLVYANIIEDIQNSIRKRVPPKLGLLKYWNSNHVFRNLNEMYIETNYV